jgi:serine/threonine protein kinase
MSSELPRQLGRYELIRKIAAGGMGEIYLARSRGTAGFEKTVIIKTILPHLADDPTFVDKFLDEGRIVVNLTHGNIVSVFDMDEVDGEYYIAMEYVPGRDLRDLLGTLRDRDEPMPVDLAAYIVSEICEGLGYAHRKTDDDGEPLDIVHRDVSPSNVLISTEGEIKLIDFGIAKAADRRAKTLSGQLQGKCCYMSPEQARGESLDARSDIFSTGVVFYEMLTGRRPFEGDSDLRSLELVRQCEAEPPGALREDLPDAIGEIVERALAEDRERRYQTIDAMQVDLMEYLYSQGQAVTNQRVAAHLREVYPDGPEREVFREAKSSSTTEGDGEELGLDEALEQELEALDADEDELDPLVAETTAPAPDDADSRGDVGHTETLTPQASETPAFDEDETTPGDDSSSHGDSDQTDEPSDASSSGAEDVSEAPPNDTTANASEHDRRDAPSEEANASTDAGDASSEGEDDLEEREATEPASDDEPPETTGFLSGWIYRGATLPVLLLVFIGLYQGVATWLSTSQGRLRLLTTPSGAEIALDGVTLVDRTTPETLRVEPGRHRVTFRADGYQSKRVTVEVDAGDTQRVDVELSKARAPRESTQSVRIEVVPPRARIRVDGRKRGRAPISIDLEPGESKLVEARAPRCDSTSKLLAHGDVGDRWTMTLDCRSEASTDTGPAADAGSVASPTEVGPSNRADPSGRRAPREAHRAVTFATEPSGAEVTVDSETIGRTPVRERFPIESTLDVTLRKEGYRPVETEVRVATLSADRFERTLEARELGCLNFFAVYPSYNEIAIDGEWLEGRRQKLERYELPAGSHTIRVRNPDAGKDETFEFDVDPGEPCTSLTVWDPDADAG